MRSALDFGEIIGQSSALKTVLEQIALVAPTEATVLIQGESGTGKELVAQAIHDRSRRRDRSMVRVNCASMPRELFESEFFGHAKGAFTGALRDRPGRFQLAEGGTLFLDEVGEIPLELQGKLLRVLQDGRYERVGEDVTRQAFVRIIAATNRDLRQQLAKGTFRDDLYYRLSVFPIEMPPLRNRKEDIPALAAHLMRLACHRLRLPNLDFKPADLQPLLEYGWPGNVRELQNVIERAVIMSRDGHLQFDRLVAPLRDPEALPTQTEPPGSPRLSFLREQDSIQLERENLLAVLQLADGRISGKGGAAELMGIRPTTLRSRLKARGIKYRS